MIKTPHKHEIVANLKLTALMILSGCAVALSFPPVGWWPFALIAWFPLIYVSRHGTARQSFYLGLLQGMVAYGLSLTWFWHIFHPAALVLYAIMALFIAFFCLLINHFSPLINNLYRSALYTALLWTSIEYYRCEWFPLRFPWITPEVAMGPNILSPIIGVYGITFIIILGTALMMESRTRIIGATLCPVPFFDDGIPGTTQLPITCSFGKIGTPICYDNDCTEVDRRLVLHGAQFLAAPSFDSMEWTSTQHLQHSMLFRIRAAENDR
jgi:apolipoprotein N-acyltransferase